MPNVLYGKDAKRQVANNLGRPLTYTEGRVVEEEGYVKDEYRDTKGIRTQGVGQTGEWIEKGFGPAFDSHVQRAKTKVPGINELPEYLMAELVQSEYRGDLSLKDGSLSKAMKLLNAGEYEASAEEFLNHAEYKDASTSPGIKARMKATSDAIRRYGREQQIG